MGLDLTLLVVEGPLESARANTQIRMFWGISEEFCEIIKAIPTVPGPTDFTSHMAFCCCPECEGGQHYGQLQTDGFDKPIRFITAAGLLNALNPAKVYGQLGESQKAALAFCEAIRSETIIGLYWG